MEFLNSSFIESTIRDDKGVNGAIFVDSILIREAELPYGNSTNKIPFHSIADKEFINSLNGLLVFKEHPSEMVSSENYNSLATQSVGSVVSAELRQLNNSNIIYGTLRITNAEMIDDIRNKRINGGSLGYYANTILENDKEIQVNLKPNHFCLTHYPRDREVVIFNSKKGVSMDKKEIIEIVNSVLAQNAKDDNFVSIPKEVFNSFMQVIESRIKDTNIKSICNSKSGLEKLTFIDHALSMKDIFNSDTELAKEEGKAEAMADDIAKDTEELEGYKTQIEELKKENSLLQEKLSKLNSEAEEDKEAGEKENESDEKENSDCESKDEKTNSVELKAPAKEVKNSIDSKYAEIANSINFI